MLNNSTTRYVRPAYGGPASNYAGSVCIRVRRETAGSATECRLVGTVPLFGVSASGTLPTTVPGLHGDQADARLLRLVLQKRSQLRKRPTVQNSPLPPCSPYPVAYPRQFFDGDPASGAFGGGNDLLRDYVVDVFGKAMFFAGELLQAPIGGSGLLRLQLRPQSALAVANRFDFAAAVDRAVRVRGDLSHTEINSEESIRPRLLWRRA